MASRVSAAASPGVGPAKPSNIRKMLVLLAVAGGAFTLGRLTSPRPPPAPGAEPSSDSIAAERPRSVGATRPSLPALKVEPAPGTAGAGEPTARRETATAMIDTLFRRLPTYGGKASPLYEVPERSARSIHQYLVGMVDGVAAAAPAMRAKLAEEFTERLCNQSLSDDQLITMASLGNELPDIVSTKGLDCVFARRGQKEDPVLWSMLDTWRHTGQEKTAAVSQIERLATDE